MVELLNLAPFGTDWVAGIDNIGSPYWTENFGSVQYVGDVIIGDLSTSSPSKFTIETASGIEPLRARIDGVTKFLINPNGGTTIGSATATPPINGLYVEGGVVLGGDLIVQKDAKHSRTDSYGFVKAGVEFSCGNIGTTRIKYFNNINAGEITVQNGPAFGTCLISLPFAYGDLYLQTTLETNVGVVIAGGCDKTLSAGSELIVCRLRDVENNTSIVVASRVTLLMF